MGWFEDWYREEIKQGWPLLKQRPTLPLAIATVAFLGGLGVASWWWHEAVSTAYDARDIAKECRNSGSELARCPVIHDGKILWRDKIVNVATPDPSQAATIADLRAQLLSLKKAPAKSVQEPPSKADVTFSDNIGVPGGIRECQPGQKLDFQHNYYSGNAAGPVFDNCPNNPDQEDAALGRSMRTGSKRFAVIVSIGQAYYSAHPDQKPSGLPPTDFINSELEKRGQDFRVRDVGPGKIQAYNFKSPSTETQQK